MQIKKFRTKIALSLLVVSLLPLLISFFLIRNVIRSHYIEREESIETRNLENNGRKLDLIFDSRIELLKSVIKNYQLIDIDIYDAAHIIINNIDKPKDIESIYIAFEDGSIITTTASWALPDDVDITQREWYETAKSSRTVAWSQPFIDLITGEWVVAASIPLLNNEGKFIGVIGADFNVRTLQEMIYDIKIRSDSRFWILNEEGNILNFNTSKDYSIEETSRQKLSGIAGGQAKLFKGIDHDNVDSVFIYYKMKSNNWSILAVTESKSFYYQLNHINNIFVSISFVSLIIVTILIFKMSDSLFKPISTLIEGVNQIERGNLSHKINTYYTDEIGDLAHSFNRMAVSLNNTYNSLKDQTCEYEASNNQLQEINEELQASYEQLQATTNQLNESEEKYRTLVENMTDFVWVVDVENEIKYVNDQVLSILGYEKEEVIGKPISLITLADMDITFSSNKNKLSQQENKSINVTLITKEGNSLICDVKTKAIYRDNNFIGVQCIGRDITEKLELQNKIVKNSKDVTTINTISRTLTSTIDLDKLLFLIVNKIVETLDVPLCTIRLLNEDKYLELKASAGSAVKMLYNRAIHINEDIMGEAIKRRKTIAVDLRKLGGKKNYNSDLAKEIKVSYGLFCPLKINSKVIGVVSVVGQFKFDDSDINVLTSLSNHVALAIQNARYFDNLKKSYIKTIKALAAAVEAKDTYTEGHSMRVSKYAVAIGKELGLSSKRIEDLEVSGLLHDIGKIGISDNILSKPGKLTEEEYFEIKKHPRIGQRILEPIGFSQNIIDGILYHHERYDGKGYPFNCSLDKLSIEPSIICVADAFDAMTSKRSYREAISMDSAMDEINKNNKTQFNPEIVDVLNNIYKRKPSILSNIMKIQ